MGTPRRRGGNVPTEGEEGRAIGRVLRLVAGSALLLAAVGIGYDEYASRVLGQNGSIGLIPAYLGTTVGMIGLLLVAHRLSGRVVASLAGLGVAGLFAFFFTYPANATLGWLGAVVVGVAVLPLPLALRLSSPLWVAAGVFGIPELHVVPPVWGPFEAYTLLGAAMAAAGAAILWGVPRRTAARRSSR